MVFFEGYCVICVIALAKFTWGFPLRLFEGQVLSRHCNKPIKSAPLKSSVGEVFDAIQSAASSFLRKDDAKTEENASRLRRDNLKDLLLHECRVQKPTGEGRRRIEDLISELALLSPVTSTARSPLLQKQWLLRWTTEKEINFFIDWKISRDITQTIDGADLSNNIEFVRGGSFGVAGTLSIPNQNGPRTSFKFTSATLDLGSWGSYQIPPVGEGWFDTIYLDDELRVDTNSRNDILICTSLT